MLQAGTVRKTLSTGSQAPPYKALPIAQGYLAGCRIIPKGLVANNAGIVTLRMPPGLGIDAPTGEWALAAKNHKYIISSNSGDIAGTGHVFTWDDWLLARMDVDGNQSIVSSS